MNAINSVSTTSDNVVEVLEKMLLKLEMDLLSIERFEMRCAL